jgi:hydrogenase nickel incorporation protein HypA/HybF
MHELSLAQGIFDIVGGAVPAEQAADVRSVRIRAGRHSGVVADSLEFCFSVLVADTPLRNASLQIETVPTVAECRDCNSRFALEDFVSICPCCGRANIALISGTELEVSEIELLDEPGEIT